MKDVNIGIIGLGTVGTGIVKTLAKFDFIHIKKIAVKNLNKKRDINNFDESILTDNPYEITQDPEINIIVEVMGGVDPTWDILKNAIENKKHIVTANKELLAKKGEELFKLASANNTVILYEAAVAGGIPIIMPMKMTLAANRINKIAAILNGTTNYILTKMDKDNADYNDVLEEAQKLGYAETDPTGDVEGYDAAYKIATLATIAFKQRTHIQNIYIEGITNISAKDMQYARELGYKIKLIALAKMNEKGQADVRVHPMLVKKEHLLSNINGVTNAVMLEGEPVGRVVMSGPGAGAFPTASSVVGDILTIISEIDDNILLPMMHCNHTENADMINISETENKYYILIKTENIPGVIGSIGTICGNHNINLACVLQKDDFSNNTNNAEIVAITELCKESNIQNAIKELTNAQGINKILSLIRVMD